MLRYRALGATRNGYVELGKLEAPIVSYRLVRGSDTLALDRVAFTVGGGTARTQDGVTSLQFEGRIADGTSIHLTYSFKPSEYLVQVQGRVTGSNVGPLLIVMPRGIRSFEADSIDDQRHLAYVFKPVNDDSRSATFAKLEGKRRIETGPFTWVGSKTKYFLAALLTDPGEQAFSTLVLTGGEKKGRNVVDAEAVVTKPIGPDGIFAYELYLGPQEWRRLHALGRDLENANPYGGFLQGVVQPFATIVMQILLWMRDKLALSYGWVLVIFGVAVRMLLWPLNQTAMRTSLRMQRLQPELTEVQKRYRQQPEKAHQEMMRIYKEHNLSPFSMFSGCLPMLLPMPVLFALFFVFQNTIEFRGVSFLWLNDISLKDPYYIIPIIMGASMFLLSWIGMRGVPPNPQTKMMAYVFPGMMMVLFANFASGLNLYYAVQNIAALPQQWLISKERQKAGPPPSAPKPQ
jgi:YidC/Oxa1 family membrane protein insertase